MARILNSNDLIIRDKETDLPTRPAQREKRVLDFILDYTSTLDECSDEDIELLLSCVKWHILGVLDKEQYALTHFAPLLSKGSKAEDIEKRLGDEGWLSTSAASVDQHYKTRAFSCSELVWLPTMANDNQLSRDSTPFEILAKPDEYISRIDVISRLWDGRDVIGGLKIFITSPASAAPVCHQFGIADLSQGGIAVHTVQLSEGEHITDVSGKSGWLIDELNFETSKSKRFGPFGGGGGSRRDLMSTVTKFRTEGKVYDHYTYRFKNSIAPGPHPRIPLDSYLVGLKGNRITDQDNFAITHLRFCFRLMTPSCATGEFLSRAEPTCEIDTMSDEQDDIGEFAEFVDIVGSDDDYDQLYNFEYYSE